MEQMDLWLTTIDQKNLLEHQKPITASTKKQSMDEDIYIINVNPNKKFQLMDGFGASFTDASAYLIHHVLDEKSRETLMEKLFKRDRGIGISFIRQPMGATDFARNLYTYDDMPKGQCDFELENFSIEHDKAYIIPLIKAAQKLNPQLKIMASPWSSPAWMKTSDNLIGGSLKEDCYDAYAKYFSKFIKAYEDLDIPIYAITPQNEPLYVPSEYPGMDMDEFAQADFISNFLGPQFEKDKIKTKIIAYDHNWDNVNYAQTVLEKSSKYVAGSAWHCYGGAHNAMTLVHDMFPDKDIYFTEASGGEWVPPFEAAFNDQMNHIIRSTRNYAKTVVWWNMALDGKNGPTVLKNSTCRGIVKIDQQTSKITYNLDYYTMGHISKFVVPGAYRVASDNYLDKIETSAFKNPDGTMVLIAYNASDEKHNIEVNFGSSGFFYYTLPSKAAATFTWNEKINAINNDTKS